jgi:uncharacterized protein DUF6600
MMKRPSPQPGIFRWFAVAALLALLPPAAALADPPSRVARLAFMEGTVSFSPAGDNDWVRASLNRPLVTGDRLWSDADGRVEIQLAGATARMGAMTSVALVNLDDRMQQFQLTQGTLHVRVRGLVSGEQIEIDTPNFAFVATRPGVYRFDVDPDGGTSTIDVRSGEGDVYGDGAAYRIAGGQAVRFRGTDLRDSVALGLPPPDPFERWAQTRDARYDRLPSASYVAPEVIGYEDLDAYGTWRAVANVGNVWIPRSVPAGWAPYRNGHWTWIDPWGWTWVDDAPWGFAPFHYGRWALVDDRWGWVPGPVRQRPVYAPALVAFIGGANFSLSVSSGQAIGWFPLGPGEVYRPAYTVSRDYFTRVNVTNTVINTTYVTNIYNNRDRVTDVRYANFARPAAITAVAPSVFALAQPVQRAAVPVDRQVLDKAEVIPLAKVAPQRESVTGASPAARGAPASAMQKPVVAKAPPPPAPVPLESKLPALRTAPGKPLDRSAADTARSGSPQPAATAPTMPPARIVKGTDPKPLPAQMSRGNSDTERGKGSGKGNDTGPVAGAPPAASPPVPAPPPAAMENPRDSAKGPPQQNRNESAKGPPPREERGPQPRPQAPMQQQQQPQQAQQAQQRSVAPSPATPPAAIESPRDSAKGPPQQDRNENAKGPPPREERGPQPRPQAQAQIQQQQQPQQAQQRSVTPSPAPPQPAPAPPPAQRAPEPRGNGNGSPLRNEGAGPQRAPAPPPQMAPQPAPKALPPPVQPPQVAPKAPPQPAATSPGQSDEARGKGKGNDNRRKEDEDKKP